jgi:outer membrane immunogenic protein
MTGFIGASARCAPIHFRSIALISTVAFLFCAGPSEAQTWSGGYVGASVGAGLQPGDASETVGFDTDLNGIFVDTVRTVAGANAFSPGFCAGIAVAPTPAAGCSSDEDGIDLGGRGGYDWQFGRLVAGLVGDVSWANVNDGVSAFSTTPAFYAFSRELKLVSAVRTRLGIGGDRTLVYGTGGGAWGRIDHRFSTSNAVNTFVPGKDLTRTDSSWGYQAGGGVEVRLPARWSLSSEYLFSSFDDANDGTVRPQGPAPGTNPFILVNPSGTDMQRTDRFEFHAVRFGLSYRF